jgi:hypothetical protein
MLQSSCRLEETSSTSSHIEALWLEPEKIYDPGQDNVEVDVAALKAKIFDVSTVFMKFRHCKLDCQEIIT